MTTALFLGGWQIPYLAADGFHWPWGAALTLPHLAVILLQVGAFAFKVVAMIFVLMLVRWTLPAFSLRSGDASGLARALPALHRQHRGHGGRHPRAGGTVVRLGQRFYIVEILSGSR